MTSKSLLIALSLFLTSATAFANPEQLSWARSFELARILFESPAAKIYKELAEQTAATSERDSFPPYLKVDCAERPLSYGVDIARGYCKITARLFYGWHADPVLVIEVSGYIRSEKIQAGTVEIQENAKGGTRFSTPAFLSKDLIVTEVKIETPIYTGLE